MTGDGHVAAQDDLLAGVGPVGIGHGHGRQQRRRVRVPRTLVEVVDTGDLDDLAEVHHRDPVADVPYDGQVVGDEDVGEGELALQIGEQVDDLRLDRDVEGRDGLVADDEPGTQGKGAGDADALPLAAGELGRKPVVVLGVEPDQLHQLLHATPPLGRRWRDPWMANGSPMIEPTRRRGFSEPYGSWKIICMSRRNGRRSRRDVW